MITVVDTILPDITSPVDFSHDVGTTGNEIVWNVGDINPFEYNVTMNGVIYTANTSWSNGSITVDIDGLVAGEYTFIIYAYDLAGNYASDTVLGNIMDPHTDQPPPGDNTDNTNSTTPEDVDPINPLIIIVSALVVVSAGVAVYLKRTGKI